MMLFTRKSRTVKTHDCVTYRGCMCEVVRMQKEGNTTFCVVVDSERTFSHSVPAHLLAPVR